MQFEEVSERVDAKMIPPDCRMRLKQRSAKPACIVTLRKVLMDQLGWTGAGQIKLLMAKNANGVVEKVRLVLDKGGKFRLRVMKFAGQVDLGYVAAFGDIARVSTGAKATKIDAKTVEIDVPVWSAVAEDKGQPDEDDDAEADAAAAPQPGAKPAAASGIGGLLIDRHGIKIMDTPKGGFQIVHKSQKMPLSDRQAKLLARMVPSINAVIPTERLSEALGLPATGGAAIVSDEYFFLRDKLREVGLTMRYQPKMGYSLSAG